MRGVIDLLFNQISLFSKKYRMIVIKVVASMGLATKNADTSPFVLEVATNGVSDIKM